MTKPEFMQELESLLMDIPLEEREEALNYYNGYFEDAGEEHEEEIMKELGSPKRVAALIKADLNSDNSDRDSRGYFTEKGYQDTVYKDDKFEIIGAAQKASEQKQTSEGNSGNREASSGFTQNEQKQTNGEANRNDQKIRNTNIGLVIILCILASPIILPVLGTMFGLIAALFGIVFGFGIAGVVMMVIGVGLFIAGLVQMSIPILGFLLCGFGLVVLGLGMLFTIACTALCKTVIPAMFKGIVEICRLPFRNRSVAA
jgi:uncharacterized membrane protein